MIYYSNSNHKEQHLTFIGRWNIMTKGHTYIMEQKMKENPGKPLLVFVKITGFDEYTSEQRAEMVKRWALANNIKITIMIIPDIKGIYFGRKVGYEVKEIEVPENIKSISATEVRKKIKENDTSWKDLIANGTENYLEELISKKQ